MPQADVPSDLVWFAPNMGSIDYPDLFSQPQQWSQTRSKTDVFKFYVDNATNPPPNRPIFGGNRLGAFVAVQAFEKLMEWELSIAVEAGAVKPWGCTGRREFELANRAIENIHTHGGIVDFLAMQEPLHEGQVVHQNGKTCGLTMEETAQVTAQFIDLIDADYRDIIVGDIEPYPVRSVSELKEWVLELEKHGVELGFFHLDVDRNRVRVEGHNVAADLWELNQFFEQRDIPFGVIFWANSDFTARRSNRSYFEDTMEWVREVKAALMEKPSHVIFQSWVGPAESGLHEVPINLPEDDSSVYSHTRLLLEGLDVFDK